MSSTSASRLALALTLAGLTGATGCSGGNPTAPRLELSTLSPTPGATAVPRTPEVTVAFSQAVDPATVGPNQIVITSALGEIAGVTGYDPQDALVRWRTTEVLPFGTRLRATLRPGIATTDGSTLGNAASWEFTVQDAVFTPPVTLPIAPVTNQSRAVLATAPATAAVAVGSEIWVLTPTSIHHEAFPFEPSDLAASNGGALAGAHNVSSPGPDVRCEVAVRRADGTWLNDEFSIVTGNVDEPDIVGGHADGFSISSHQSWLIVRDFHFVGPRPSTPEFTKAITSSAHTSVTHVALGPETLAAAFSGQGETPRVEIYDLSGPDRQLLHTWPQPPIRVMRPDRTGALLLHWMDHSSGEAFLERRLSDGTVTAKVSHPLSQQGSPSYRVLLGNGTGALLKVSITGDAVSLRLDASHDHEVLRGFELPNDTAASQAFAGYYADSGTLWIIGRVWDPVRNGHSLQLWQQYPNAEWQGPTRLLAAEPGRVLGLPDIALDAAGQAIVAVPRARPDELVVFRTQ